MRTLLPLVLASTAACAAPAAATRAESREVFAREVIAREVIAVDTTPPPVEPAKAARPRLSRTITLGQDSETYAYSAPVASAPAPATAPTVIVNNQTNVMVGGGYGYGYGPTYGYFPRTSAFRSGGFAGGTPTGWEGARRTAAPGQTPPIGGNWPTVPSYGPAQMR